MEFFINKNATLPLLKMELVNDGRNDFNSFYEKIQNANIKFTMINLETGVKKIGLKNAGLSLVTPVNCVGEEYYITYQFSENDTNTFGRFVGKFNIEFLDGSGTLIAPISETLYINILDNGIKK